MNNQQLAAIIPSLSVSSYIVTLILDILGSFLDF